MITLLLALAPAFAASATPDRPARTLTPDLVQTSSLEAELGGLWQGSDDFAMPLRVKYGYAGQVEPRLDLDLAGMGQGRPGMNLGAKVRLARQREWGLALYGDSNVPLGDTETWRSSLQFLGRARVSDRLTLLADLGAELGPVAGTIGVTGVPASLMGVLPLGGAMSALLEAGLTIDNPARGGVLDAGLRWRITDALVVDGQAGWDMDLQLPFVGVGATVNAGLTGR